MKVVALSGSNVGTITRTAMDYTLQVARENYSDAEITLINPAEVDMVFSDGRNYNDYEGIQKQLQKQLWKQMRLLLEHNVSSINSCNIKEYLLPVNSFHVRLSVSL